jgi:hypothetical protein
MFMMHRSRAAGDNKGVFAGTPVPDIGDLLKNCHFRGSSGLHKLYNIHLEAAPCCPHSQTHRPGGFSDSLTIIDV